jgi:hypothetical protein
VERDEYETYVSFLDFLGLLQAKARKLVAEDRPANGRSD